MPVDSITTINQLAFEFAPEDIWFEVFKYLNVRERIRFERVSKRFKFALDRLWAAQKVLSINYQRTIKDIVQECPNKSHWVNEVDCAVNCDQEAIKKIVLKCP